MRNIPSVEQLLAACHSQDSEQQCEAMTLLAQYYPDIAPGILMELLTSSNDSTVRLKSVGLLGELATKNMAMGVPALLKALNDAESAVRSRAIHTLLNLRYPLPKESLLSLLHDDPDQQIRKTIVEVVGYLNDISYLPELEKSFQKETSPAVRAKIIRSIGLIASANYLPKLENYLSLDAAPAVQRELFAALYRLGDRTKLESLLYLLEKADAKAVWSILFTIQYLVKRRPPTFLRADSAAIRKAVTNLTTRLPAFSIGVQPLLEALTKLENQL